ncbi:uncharacterized protein MKK02DRAFT_28727 [Dioszegia hungarica]|uniref:t-SNARE coiled-coil homology domain-containing protein n=1 Tax=Dioszegia hungarica TaxID=4972 RepID=A0AA38H4K7_9TREE|nr:uncharacterized protein MKK02DRAFT_28727 [Dioszegia hungarica]KAI9633998.1 hypothetical protein MKK02DRAFT_28727 [Dioszegia hungarica]
MTTLLTLPPHLVEKIQAILAAKLGDKVDANIRAGLKKVQQDVSASAAEQERLASALAARWSELSGTKVSVDVGEASLGNAPLREPGLEEDGDAPDQPPPTIDEEVLVALSKWASTGIGRVTLKRKGLDPDAYSLISLLAGTEVYLPPAVLARLRAADNPDKPDPFLPSYLSAKPPSLGSEYRALTRNLASTLNILFSIFGSAGAVYAAGVSGAGYSRETALLLAILAAVVVAVAEGVLYWIFKVRLRKGREESAKMGREMNRGSAKLGVLDSMADVVGDGKVSSGDVAETISGPKQHYASRHSVQVRARPLVLESVRTDLTPLCCSSSQPTPQPTQSILRRYFFLHQQPTNKPYLDSRPLPAETAMSNPALLALSQRLTSTSSLLLERSRVISLNLPPSASSQNQIVRNLTSIKNDLAKFEDELQLESSGLSVGGRDTPSKKGGKSREGDVARQLREAGESFDRLVEIFGEDEVGREKAKILRRAPKQSTAVQNPVTPDPIFTSTLSGNNNPSRPTSAIPRVEIEPPTPAGNPNMPFRDYPDGRRSGDRTFPHAYTEDEEDDRDDREIMDSQEMVMQDQDDRLALLSTSIGRQNHLSIQIGSELDQHHELLEDVDGAMDRTAARLGGARKRLDKVANDAKQYGRLTGYRPC